MLHFLIDAMRKDPFLEHLKSLLVAGRWWLMPLIPALGRQGQADLCEFEASLVYES